MSNSEIAKHAFPFEKNHCQFKIPCIKLCFISMNLLFFYSVIRVLVMFVFGYIYLYIDFDKLSIVSYSMSISL